MATDERFKKKTEQVRILLDDLKKLSRFDNSTVPTLLRIRDINDPYNLEEKYSLARAFKKEGGIELFMKMLTSLSPDASNIPDSLQRVMEWSTFNVLGYVVTLDPMTTFVDCGGLKFLLGLLKHHACQGLMLRFESRNTLRFAVTTLTNLSMEPELKSCFHQELAADVLACYLDVPDAPCKLSALCALARVSTEQDLDIICNAQGAISLLTDMVNRPSYKNYTALENILCPAAGLVKTLTMVSITAGIRRKTERASSSLDKKVLEELIPKLREKLKVEVEKRDYTLEWGDIAVHPTRRSVQKWPKARDGRIYVPYKVSIAFYDGDIKKIEEAVLEFEKKTCVRFIPRSEEADYIYIHAREGNWSFLGRQGGDQAMSLEPGKVTKGVVLHELMHALGFHHEHCRSDRDQHIWVHNHNIKPDWVDAIVKTTTNGHNLTTPYDYSSILHYGATAGSKDGHSPTLSPKDTRNMHRFGGGHTLSDGDVLKIMEMYDGAMAPQQSVMVPVLWNGPSSTGRAFKEAGISHSHTVDSQVGVWMKPKNGAENKSKGPTIRGDVALSRSCHRVMPWPKHRDGNIYIPYEVSSGFYAHDKEAITKAVQEFEKKTHIRFHPRSNERDFVHIQALDGNWSFLGRQGGDQALSLEPGKVTKGTVLHELMHALGFHHEHCRSDRDQHVWVLSDNVKEEWKHAIVPKTSAEHDTVTPYDYSSIMHYSMMAGCVDDHSPTIIPKNPVHMLHVGHGNSLSAWDVRKVQMLYGYEMAALLPPVRQTARPDHPASAGDERGQSNSAAERATPVAELIGAWRKKTKKDEEDRIQQKEENHEKTKDPVRKVLRELKKFSRFDGAAVLTLECLLEELTAECSKEEKMLRHSAYKDEGGPELLKKILDSPKSEDVRIPLLEMLSKIFNAVAVQTSDEKSKVYKSGDIAGDPSEEVVQWPKHKDGNVYIPYNVSIAFNRSEKNVIENAIQEFQRKTCVHFIPRIRELDYINFQALDGSWSFLGKKGGAQSLSLKPGKVDKGTVLHELMHALGFHHEHCRSDRDQHIKVHEDNIKEADLCQFKRLESSDRDYGLPYDFDSILHYSRCASSIDGVSPTIVPIKQTTTSFGQRDHLSTNDVLKVQRMYEEAREKLKMETERQDVQLRGRGPGFLRKVETSAQANSKVMLAAASADNAAWSSVISQIKSKQGNATSQPRRRFPLFN